MISKEITIKPRITYAIELVQEKAVTINVIKAMGIKKTITIFKVTSTFLM